MINGISLQGLRNSEFLQFVTDILSIVNLNNPQTLLVQEQYDNLLAAKNTVAGLFNKDQASAITEELAALDAQRDDLINGIIAVVQGNTYHFDSNIKKQALALQTNINSYGAGIARENYQSETAIIQNLLKDWATKAELTAAINALQLGAWKTQLETANTNFSAKYLARTQEQGAAPAESLKEKRMVATKAYYELRDFLDSYYTINKKAAPFSKATNEINALVEQYTKLITGRGKTGEGEAPAAPVG